MHLSRSDTPDKLPRLAGFHFWTLCSSHSHSQRRVPFALFSSPPSRPRCPDDASQKRFSWFSDWIQKVHKCVNHILNLVDLVTSFETSIYLQKSVSTQPRTSLSKFVKKSPKVEKVETTIIFGTLIKETGTKRAYRTRRI